MKMKIPLLSEAAVVHPSHFQTNNNVVANNSNNSNNSNSSNNSNNSNNSNTNYNNGTGTGSGTSGSEAKGFRPPTIGSGGVSIYDDPNSFLSLNPDTLEYHDSFSMNESDIYQAARQGFDKSNQSTLKYLKVEM